MPTYTLETQRGRKLTIESDSPDNAMRLADQWDLEDHAASEAQKVGVNPDLALRVMNRESGGKANAVSPKGAMGPMQLMPGTAKDLGVDPSDPYQNITGGVTYLKKMIDRYGGDEAKGLAAYNAGPGAVDKYGGVPPFAETQGYVKALAGKSAPGLPAPIQTGPAPVAARPASKAPVSASGLLKSLLTGAGEGAAPIADTLLSAGPLGVLKHAADLMGLLHGGAAPSPGGGVTPFAQQAATLGHKPQNVPEEYARTVGQMLPNAAAPAAGIGGRIANVIAPAVASETSGQVARAAGGGSAVENAARLLGGVAGAGLASVRPNAQGLRRPNVRAAVEMARDDAYAAVRQSGDLIPQAQVKDLSSQFSALVKEKAGPDPKAYLASVDMAARLKEMAKAKAGVTLDQLDTLRSDVYDGLVAAGDREAPLGVKLRGMIDQAISDTGNPDILAARDLHTRATKIGTIEDEVRSAQLRASTANSGQNVNNSIRQELRPLIDPTRNQQITNFSPEELAAMTRAVSGSRGQNAMRDASNILRNRFLQGMLVAPTLGTVPVGMEVAGRMLNRGAENATLANVRRVIDMVAAGHPGSAAPPVLPAAPRPLTLAENPYAGLALPGMAMALSAAPAAAQDRRPRKRHR